MHVNGRRIVRRRSAWPLLLIIALTGLVAILTACAQIILPPIATATLEVTPHATTSDPSSYTARRTATPTRTPGPTLPSTPSPTHTPSPSPSPVSPHKSGIAATAPGMVIRPAPWEIERAPLPTPAAYNVELISRLGGVIEAVVVHDNHAFAGGRSGLTVLDLSDPVRPVHVGYLSIPVLDLEVVDSYAYVADTEIGLRVLDLSNPAAPIEIGRYELPDTVEKLAVVDSADHERRYVFAATYEKGLFILDATDPASPVQVGTFWTSGYSDLALMDVSDPSLPVLIASSPPELNYYAYNYELRTIAVAGKYVYVVNEEALHILDVSKPRHPVQAGFYDPLSSASGLTLAGDYLYLTQSAAYNSWNYRGALSLIDVSEPAAPAQVAFMPLEYPADGVITTDRYVYVNRGHCSYWGWYCTGGLSVFDATTPANLTEIASYQAAAPGLPASESGSQSSG